MKEYKYTVSSVLALLLITLAVQWTNWNTRNGQVYVPKSQKRIAMLVRKIESNPQSHSIRTSQFGSLGEPVKTIPVHLRTKFELSEDKLKLLGITFSEQLIKYEGNITGGYLSFEVKEMESVSVSVYARRTGIKEYAFYPWFLSDENGKQNVRYRFDNEDALKMTNTFFISAIDQLVPIQVARPGFRKVIFWYSQTPELMKILESCALVPDNSMDEKNFDEKKNTVDIQIFPTMTNGPVQITANVLRDQYLDISVLSSSGEVLLVPVSKTLLEGEHDFSLDLSNFNNGLYFIRIQSKPGLITMHRLFKE